MLNNTLRVMWFVPPAIAIAAEWEPPQALQFESSRTQSSDEQYQALCDGTVDAVITSMDNVLHWNQRQGPDDFAIVAQVETTTPLSLIGSVTVTSLEELKGGNILVDAPENGFVIALRALLLEAGIGLGEYHLDPVGGVRERFTSLIEAGGDATLLGPPFDTMALELGHRLIATIQDAFPAFPGQGLVVRRSSAPRQALKIWIDSLSRSLSALPYQQERLRESLQKLNLPPAAVSALINTFPKTLIPDRKGMELLIAQRAALGLVGSHFSYEQVVDGSFLQ